MLAFEACASSAFKGVQLDEMGPSGPCIAKIAAVISRG
jgi:hypothetical protein